MLKKYRKSQGIIFGGVALALSLLTYVHQDYAATTLLGVSGAGLLVWGLTAPKEPTE
jgi:hypothetical protein